jgi:plastocyanin
MAFRPVALLLTLATLALAGCSSGEHEDPEVDIHGNTFDPASLTIRSGEHVHFNNHDGVAHTATSDTGAFDTGNIAGGASGSAQFDRAGTFPYHCKIHPSMKGTIVVQ